MVDSINKNERPQLVDVGASWPQKSIWDKILDWIANAPELPYGVQIIPPSNPGKPSDTGTDSSNLLDRILAILKGGGKSVSVSPAQPNPRPGKGIDDQVPSWAKDLPEDDKRFIKLILDASTAEPSRGIGNQVPPPGTPTPTLIEKWMLEAAGRK